MMSSEHLDDPRLMVGREGGKEGGIDGLLD